jgi:hypothetical protein
MASNTVAAESSGTLPKIKTDRALASVIVDPPQSQAACAVVGRLPIIPPMGINHY